MVNYLSFFIVDIIMSSLRQIYIQPISPDLALLYVIGIVIILIVMLCLLYLVARDEIWEQQHSI